MFQFYGSDWWSFPYHSIRYGPVDGVGRELEDEGLENQSADGAPGHPCPGLATVVGDPVQVFS